ncbi:MAG: hypothetical protein AAGA35_01235 [Patescibacteria group bacterium]
MPRKNGVRPGRSRSRKLKGLPPSAGRAVSVPEGKTILVITTIPGAIDAALSMPFLTVPVSIDDGQAPDKNPASIRKFQK